MGTEQINNYSRYIELMKNGYIDKLFWVDKIFDDWNSIVDYGCADGFLCSTIKNIFPEKQVVGYDIDPEMIRRAQRDYGTERKEFQPTLSTEPAQGPITGSYMVDRILFTTNVAEAKGDVLYLSSIIHEIYSYCSADEIKKFWDYVFNSGFKYIIIRDMIYDEDINRKSDVNTVRKIHNWATKTNNEKYLNEFERLWGSISEYKMLIHFLLKSNYQIGWEREVRENYLPLSVQHLYELIPPNYRIDYAEHYTLPYLKDKWEKDMGVYIDEKIHSKFIIKKI